MLKNNYSGKFIVFEGLDGSGQTTQVRLLKDFLESKGYNVITTKEPTSDSEAGRKIRQILDEKEKINPDDLQKLFAKDRQKHLDHLIIPLLKEGKIVISDRYFFSSFAYGVSEGLSLDWLIELNNDFFIPDLTFILKVRAEVSISRIEKRGEPKTLFEKQEKLAKVWENYQIMPERFKKCFLIDGEKSIEEVFEEIKKQCNNILTF